LQPEFTNVGELATWLVFGIAQKRHYDIHEEGLRSFLWHTLRLQVQDQVVKQG
jgi:hypothetical protein